MRTYTQLIGIFSLDRQVNTLKGRIQLVPHAAFADGEGRVYFVF